jgi:hypothetical protein
LKAVSHSTAYIISERVEHDLEGSNFLGESLERMDVRGMRRKLELVVDHGGTLPFGEKFERDLIEMLRAVRAADLLWKQP